MISARNIALAACIVGMMAPQAFAADEMLEGAKQQMELSNQLIALGRERKDAILVLAGAHLRNNITNDPIGEAGDIPDKADLMEEAKMLAGDRDDLKGIADDIDAASSRGCYNWNGGTGSFSCPPGSQFAN
ncbi:hypothetical protein [Oricola sp.]|uniref:hypothetical protein n=1 Tax=Oricola sp. TaxID=1979950 RepID=UPI00320BF341|nr:hypothetical protein [Oricola sp.]